MKKNILIVILLMNIFLTINAQEESKMIQAIFDEALTDQTAYENLRFLCKNYNGRITGSSQAADAVEFAFQILINMNLDKVSKQPVLVPHWVRGDEETASIQSDVWFYAGTGYCAGNVNWNRRGWPFCKNYRGTRF